MSKLQEVAKVESSKKLTENGAVAYDTANCGALVDLFGTVGAMRSRSEKDIVAKFAAAFDEDPLLTTKTLFYCGDIRNGGLGERRTFRIGLKWMAQNHEEIILKNIGLIPYYNRWDSIYELFDTPCEKEAIELIRAQLIEDITKMKNGKPISLIAKWLKSENTSSKKSKLLGTKTRKGLGLSVRHYRQMLSTLRSYLKVVETYMSAGEWDKIEFAEVPSYAMKNYRNAFSTHETERFQTYLDALKEGKTKINASVLFPYDLTSQYIKDGGTWSLLWVEKEDEVIEQQWKALPNYVENESNILVMADVSGSMWGRPIETSIGLAIYFAERNRGPLENVYMTFTDQPHFQYINAGGSLLENINKVLKTDVGYHTDLKAAFNYLLEVAVKKNFEQSDMPAAICVISDMEIDPYFEEEQCWMPPLWNKSYSLDFVQVQKEKYAAAGYELPKLIMWNVEARQDTFLTSGDDVIFVSGQSPSTFKHLAASLDGKTAYDFMIEVLCGEAYDKVTV